MNSIASAIKIDFYILKSLSVWSLLLVIGVAVLAGVILSSPMLIIGIVLMTAAFYISGLFGVVERNNLNRLYGILPVKRGHLVIARYLFAISIGILSSILGIILAFLASFVVGSHASPLQFSGWVCASFFLFCLIVALQFPVYFRYEFSNVSIAANVPIIIIFVAWSALIKERPDLYLYSLRLFAHHRYWNYLAGIGGGLLLMGISSLLSLDFFKGRDL